MNQARLVVWHSRPGCAWRFAVVFSAALIALGSSLGAAEPPAAWQLTLRAARPGAVFDVAETPCVTALRAQ